MASDPINSLHIDGEKTENSDKLVFSWIPKSLQMMAVAMNLKDACSLEEKLSRQHIKSRQHINLDSILKSRDITLPAKVCLVKAMVFPVVMYGCESWAIKKAVSKYFSF